MSSGGLTDVHAHLAALPTPANGCRVSRRMRDGLMGRLVCRLQGLIPDDPEASNRRFVDNLERSLAASERVSRAVLLGMDGVYGADGRLDESLTEFLISNDAVFSACMGRERLSPGPSVNPRRRDALDELERCAALGAALVKVLPNAQAFDPADPAFKPFYRALARLKLPLLSHVGYEFTLAGRDQSVGDPLRLIPALEEGVAVIAAHGGSAGLFVWERYFGSMLELFKRFPNFHADTSALTLPNRVGGLFRLRRHPEVFGRLLFGTDYPLHVFAYPCLGALSAGGYIRALRAKTAFDRQAAVLEAFGISWQADPWEALRPA